MKNHLIDITQTTVWSFRTRLMSALQKKFGGEVTGPNPSMGKFTIHRNSIPMLSFTIRTKKQSDHHAVIRHDLYNTYDGIQYCASIKFHIYNNPIDKSEMINAISDFCPPDKFQEVKFETIDE